MQVDNRDALYHAVDLMELSVTAGTQITIAHDDRLPRPPWLTKDFAPLAEKLTVNGVAFTLFRRDCATAQSLTFGPNSEQTKAPAAAMYLVFVNTK